MKKRRGGSIETYGILTPCANTNTYATMGASSSRGSSRRRSFPALLKFLFLIFFCSCCCWWGWESFLFCLFCVYVCVLGCSCVFGGTISPLSPSLLKKAKKKNKNKFFFGNNKTKKKKTKSASITRTTFPLKRWESTSRKPTDCMMSLIAIDSSYSCRAKILMARCTSSSTLPVLVDEV